MAFVASTPNRISPNEYDPNSTRKTLFQRRERRFGGLQAERPELAPEPALSL
jgi:hypothetical protein